MPRSRAVGIDAESLAGAEPCYQSAALLLFLPRCVGMRGEIVAVPVVEPEEPSGQNLLGRHAAVGTGAVELRGDVAGHCLHRRHAVVPIDEHAAHARCQWPLHRRQISGRGCGRNDDHSGREQLAQVCAPTGAPLKEKQNHGEAEQSISGVGYGYAPRIAGNRECRVGGSHGCLVETPSAVGGYAVHGDGQVMAVDGYVAAEIHRCCRGRVEDDLGAAQGHTEGESAVAGPRRLVETGHGRGAVGERDRARYATEMSHNRSGHDNGQSDMYQERCRGKMSFHRGVR
ncbi:unknown [Prevotella sp. CAG:1031]|nr:unknown [Prevotella sp. CAG:1031]